MPGFLPAGTVAWVLILIVLRTALKRIFHIDWEIAAVIAGGVMVIATIATHFKEFLEAVRSRAQTQ